MAPALAIVPPELDSPPWGEIIRSAAQHGPNFAGHYTVVEWGCGTQCRTLRIMDARTGELLPAGAVITEGAAYRIDSELLIVDPPELWSMNYGAGGPSYMSPRAKYYRWTGKELKLIQTIDVRRLYSTSAV